MALSRRQKLVIAALALYWPAIFILSHIPMTRLPRVGVSDKTLHYFAYMVLIFLLWFAISPNKKVNWRKPAVWWVLFVVVWYGVMDEWLQSYVGRNADVKDFIADLVGALTSLILLTIVPFWPASLILTAATIFVLTNLVHTNFAGQLHLINAAFHFCGYGLFTSLWIRYMKHLLPIRAPETKWLIGALALPIGFMAAVWIFSAITADSLPLVDVAISMAAIVIAVAAVFLSAVFVARYRQEVPDR